MNLSEYHAEHTALRFGFRFSVVRCCVFLRKKIKKISGTSDSLTENHAMENQAKGHGPYGLSFTPNKQVVQMENREKILNA